MLQQTSTDKNAKPNWKCQLNGTSQFNPKRNMSIWKKLFGAKESPKIGITERKSPQTSATSISQDEGVAFLRHLYGAAKGDVEVVKAMLKDYPHVVSWRNEGGACALDKASAEGHVAVVAVLLQNKAEVNDMDPMGLTALHYAAGCGRKAVVELLLANKADVNAKCKEKFGGKTPLDLALEKGFKDIAELLRKHGGQETNVP